MCSMRAVGRLLLRSLGVQEHEMKAVQPAALCFFAVREPLVGVPVK